MSGFASIAGGGQVPLDQFNPADNVDAYYTLPPAGSFDIDRSDATASTAVDASQSTGDVTFNSGGGSDTFTGGSGDDIGRGGTGGDVFSLGEGSNRANGNDGNDTLIAGDGGNTISGGNGDDRILSGTGDDRLGGDDGNDTIFGGGGSDTIAGGSGSDYLIGGAGDDNITGGEGDDTLMGGSGNDTLAGGSGADTFVFDANGFETGPFPGTGNDVIKGFELGSDFVQFAPGTYGITSLSDLSSKVSYVNASTVKITLDPSNSITVVAPGKALQLMNDLSSWIKIAATPQQ